MVTQMITLTERQAQVDDLLEAVTVLLQIPVSRYEEAVSHYDTVGRWLSKESSTLKKGKPRVTSFGSIATRTEVPPLKRDVFDLDALCLFRQAAGLPAGPRDLFDAVVNRIAEHGDLSKRMTIDAPAIKLAYANQFTLEIVPARPLSFSNAAGPAQIVDYDENEWIASDPKGYIEWFDNAGIVTESDIRTGYLAKSSSVDPAPKPAGVAERRPLARTVQLIKRRRDRYYTSRLSDYRPESIVIATMSAERYGGQALCLPSLRHILAQALNDSLRSDGLWVYSPVLPEDCLNEHWSSGKHRHFQSFLRDFLGDLDQLENARNINEISGLLGGMFGDDLSRSAIEGYTTRHRESTQHGDHGFQFDRGGSSVAPIVLAGSSVPGFRKSPKHNFYGN